MVFVNMIMWLIIGIVVFYAVVHMWLWIRNEVLND
mgnify:CR=1 FL=1